MGIDLQARAGEFIFLTGEENVMTRNTQKYSKY
jgi:hypothetical protein